MTIDQILQSRKVLVCCGSGGVGKTTLSAALGVRAAELGLKTMVLTIDPARRLVSALGLEKLQNETPIEGAFKGTLHAGMLDMKKTFDDFVIQFAPSPAVADRVLRNGVYQQLSTALSGSQEFTALEKLLQLTSSGKYDLVILDTPPTKHAIDFLNAPLKIHTLFQDSIIKWFLAPFSAIDKVSAAFWHRGTKMAFKVFETIVGNEFLTNLTEFFVSIRDWQKNLRDRAAEVHRLLTAQSTGFVLVTGFNAIKIEEARYFERTLKKGGFFLNLIIVNRAFPLWRDKAVKSESGGVFRSENYKKLRDYYEKLNRFFSVQQNAFKSFAGEVRANTLVVRLPDLDQDIHDLESLKALAGQFSTGALLEDADA
ncbi:MAG: ArsA family ATPase [Oligoflexia bacterium]|nr:ArsA family ATPase [Oligoflexia bacterium]